MMYMVIYRKWLTWPGTESAAYLDLYLDARYRQSGGVIGNSLSPQILHSWNAVGPVNPPLLLPLVQAQVAAMQLTSELGGTAILVEALG